MKKEKKKMLIKHMIIFCQMYHTLDLWKVYCFEKTKHDCLNFNMNVWNEVPYKAGLSFTRFWAARVGNSMQWKVHGLPPTWKGHI